MSTRQGNTEHFENSDTAYNLPDEIDSDITFEDLFDLDEIQRLQDLFAQSTKVASIITHTDGTPITKPSNFCVLCSQIIRNTEKGCANCFKSDSALGRYHPSGPIVQPCLSGGLWDAGASISVGKKHIASWLIGQVRDETQTEEAMLKYAEEIGADKKEFIEAFRKVTPMSHEQFQKAAETVFVLANQLSKAAYQNILRGRLISELEKNHQLLCEKEEKLKATLNSIGDAVISTDIEYRIVRMNPVAEKLTGWSLDEARGKDIDEIFNLLNVQAQEEIPTPVKEVISKGKAISMNQDILLTAKDSSIYHIADSCSPIMDEKGNITGSVMVFRDITEKHILQEQLNQSRKLDAIGHLAGGVAHDFNNMLGGIMGAADILALRLADTPDLMKFVDIIIKTAENAGELTDKLLSFARKGKLISTPIDAHLTINEAITLMKHTIDKRVQIETNLAAEDSLIVGDPAQLQSAILNLGINAAQAMPEGGTISFASCIMELDEPFCEASTFELTPGQYIEICIRDTGCGIPPENLEKIFDPFFTTKGANKGTGLGLSAVYGAVKQHHGSISVYSEINKGTVFKLCFPLNKSRPARTTYQSKTTVTGHGQILVVDDEAVIRATASIILEGLGYEVQLATNGLEAVEIFKKDGDKIDAVLMDMIMPKMNGRECFAKLKEINPNVRVVVSSGFSGTGEIENMLKNGAMSFVRKPYRSVELSQAIANAIK